MICSRKLSDKSKTALVSSLIVLLSYLPACTGTGDKSRSGNPANPLDKKTTLTEKRSRQTGAELTIIPSPLPPSNVLYDYQAKKYIGHPGGINESFLNATAPNNFEPDLINFLQKVDQQEFRLKFLHFGEHEGLLSSLETIVTAIKNMRLIKEIDKAKNDDINDRYIPLKKLINDLNKIYYKKYPHYMKLEHMYDCIKEKIQPGKSTKESVGIEILACGEKGDCNDIATAFFSLFNYYHIETGFRFGKVIDEKHSGLHVWLSALSEKGIIDLDPTWYGFVPLEERRKDIEIFLFKEEYLTRKEN